MKRSSLPCSWDDFQAYVDEREPKMLRAFTSLEVNPAGQYDLKHIKSELLSMVIAAPLRPVMHMHRLWRARLRNQKREWLRWTMWL